MGRWRRSCRRGWPNLDSPLPPGERVRERGVKACSSRFMGRWREAPEGLADMAPPHLWGGSAKRRRGWQIWLLPIHGEVARSAGGAGGYGSSPFMGRWRESAGGAGRYGSSPFMGRWREAPEGLVDSAPPHSWGGGAKSRRGRTT